MIELVDKTHGELVTWVPAMFASYVEQRIGAGEDPASSVAQAAAQRQQLFPDDVPAEGQHVMTVRDDGEDVGVLWMGRPLGMAEATWFVFYVEVAETRRGKGLGRATMQAAEAWTVEHGGSRIALTVFGTNTVARSLYDSLGFVVLATNMYKDLSA